MINNTDIGINIRFSGGSSHFPSSLVTQIIDVIDDAIFETQKRDLELWRMNHNENPALTDAALYRIEKHRGKSLFIEGTHKGSLIVTGIVAALAYWVLENTVGETFKEAWTKTESHSRLKEFFLWRKKDKAMEIKREVDSKLRYLKYEKNQEVEIFTSIGGKNDREIFKRSKIKQSVQIEVVYRGIDVPPIYSELMNDEDKK